VFVICERLASARPMSSVEPPQPSGSSPHRSPWRRAMSPNSSRSLLPPHVFALTRARQKSVGGKAIENPIDRRPLDAKERARLVRSHAHARHLREFTAHTRQRGTPDAIGHSIEASSRARQFRDRDHARVGFKPHACRWRTCRQSTAACINGRGP